ncbi:hypothetical protein X943_002947 [Babesia divergens]|uniref:Uncharacterized protein n=1 Tax=Babesia divergens TaxID=32595 RepID=A0AAD9GAJ4_BABDI|nr:hypothetical protein X943_002947 [Babesia divergens]
MKTHCLARDAGTLRCSLKDYLFDTTRSRYEASTCFLTVLKLATQGMVCLEQEDNDIAVEILQ